MNWRINESGVSATIENIEWERIHLILTVRLHIDGQKTYDIDKMEFYAVNTNYPEEQAGHQYFSRKLKADVFIDDRNVGGLFDWNSIYRIIHYRLKLADLVDETLDEKLGEAVEKRKQEKKKKQSLLGRLFG